MQPQKSISLNCKICPLLLQRSKKCQKEGETVVQLQTPGNSVSVRSKVQCDCIFVILTINRFTYNHLLVSVWSLIETSRFKGAKLISGLAFLFLFISKKFSYSLGCPKLILHLMSPSEYKIDEGGRQNLYKQNFKTNDFY